MPKYFLYLIIIAPTLSLHGQNNWKPCSWNTMEYDSCYIKEKGLPTKFYKKTDSVWIQTVYFEKGNKIKSIAEGKVLCNCDSIFSKNWDESEFKFTHMNSNCFFALHGNYTEFNYNGDTIVKGKYKAVSERYKQYGSNVFKKHQLTVSEERTCKIHVIKTGQWIYYDEQLQKTNVVDYTNCLD